uniref:Uncharacterized protein n=1 Tax=Rhizophora mucronata TaxID=61149 RepID=A0A2P2NHD8_RHIMU
MINVVDSICDVVGATTITSYCCQIGCI